MYIIGRGRIGTSVAGLLGECELVGHEFVDLEVKHKYKTIINCALDPKMYERILSKNELIKSLFLNAKSNLSRYIYLSTRMVYNRDAMINATEDAKKEPESYYGENKLRQEEILGHEIPTEQLAILRLPNLVFNKSNTRSEYSKAQFFDIFLKNLREDRKIELSGTPSTIKDFLHSDDLARSILHIEELRLSGVYNVSYGKGIMYKDMIHVALDIDPGLEIKWNTNNRDDSFYLNSDKLKKFVAIEGNTSLIIKNRINQELKGN